MKVPEKLMQFFAPLENHDTITQTIVSLDSQIADTSDPSLSKPLGLQRERLILQQESFERVMKMLEGYKKNSYPKAPGNLLKS